MQKKYFILVAIFILIFGAASFVYYKKTSSIDYSVSLAKDYLKKNTNADGRFVYSTNLKRENQYNVLRHAGVLYSMSLYEKYYGDDLKDTKLAASKYLVKNYVQEIKSNIFAVVSKPDEEAGKVPAAKLGASGLALLGLADYYDTGEVEKKILNGFGEYILFMQKPDGSFYSKYDINSKQKDANSMSRYYPGEVAYGLLFLNDKNPQKKWVNSSKKALLYLAKLRKNEFPNTDFDHWSMLAINKLFKTKDNGLEDFEKNILKEDATNMAKMVIAMQVVDKKDPYVGSLYGNQRLCSIATIMEGMAAIYEIIDDEDLKKEVYNFLSLGNEFLSKYQVKRGILKGGIPTDAKWKVDRSKKVNAIRIDNVQHTMSAWILFLNLKK